MNSDRLGKAIEGYADAWRVNALPLATRQVNDHRRVLGSVGWHRVPVDQRLREYWRLQCLGQICLLRCALIEQLALLRVD